MKNILAELFGISLIGYIIYILTVFACDFIDKEKVIMFLCIVIANDFNNAIRKEKKEKYES